MTFSGGGDGAVTRPGARLRVTVDALRAAKAESPELFSYLLGGTVDEETARDAAAEGVPAEFLDFCRVLDGASCGPSVQLFGLEEALGHQFYCDPIVDCVLPLSPEKLFCVGMIHETPVYVDRAGGGVLGIPAEHREWPDAERFEHLAPGLEEFFVERLATAEYLRIGLVDDESAEYDEWLTLLRRAGLAA
ncbi:hypothetical protein [Streptomyces neyagawaensis]|uniref:Knr4/Smi1-like domain-containing protein n=1 Tax=Streptomyces neyagawaensis TaxID=42238 RepID=A0ABV3B257_9ACTN